METTEQISAEELQAFRAYRAKQEEARQRAEQLKAERAAKAAEEYGMPGNLVAGANIAGFLKVADAMLWQGIAY